MDKDFWQERWARQEIGFHQSDIQWALKRHWADISPASNGDVFVPLCGKSLDMHWLAERGHGVTGVELSGQAIDEFFDEWGRDPERSMCGGLPCRKAETIELVEGDFFAFHPDRSFELFYDRAALVALPEDMRPAYLSHLRDILNVGARGLLVTFEYDREQMSGPPFPIESEELFAQSGLGFDLLERRDVLAGHERFAAKGLDALHECAWQVTRL